MPKHVRVLQLIDSLDSTHGGPPVSAFGLGSSLVENVCNVEMMTMSDKTRLRGKRERLVDGVHITEYPALRIKGRAFSLSFALGVFREARNSDAVVVHAFYLWHSAIGGLAARAWHKRLVIHPHGVFERYQQKQSARSKQLYNFLIGNWVTKQAYAVVVADQSEVEGAADLVPLERVHVVSHGVAPSPISARSQAHTPVRLLSLSRIAPKKRIDISIRAVAILKSAGTASELTIAGTGEKTLTEELAALTRELDVSSSVRFVGHMEGSTKVELLRDSDIFLLPSENENFAIAAAEALSAGIPAVVTKAVALHSRIGNQAGRVITLPDAEELAAAISSLVVSDSSYETASTEAKRVATEDLSWSTAAQNWLMAVFPDIQHTATKS